MVIYFISGNKNKFVEFESVFFSVCDEHGVDKVILKQLDIDLDEVQELDARKVVEHKLRDAVCVSKKFTKDDYIICEDTSLYIDALNGFPGPLIKWLSKSIGDEGIAAMVLNYNEHTAVAKTFIGCYSCDSKKINFFEGDIKGDIVAPRGKNGFGWDKIFLPDILHGGFGADKTFAEMNADEKNEYSMRRIATEKLAEYLCKKMKK